MKVQPDWKQVYSAANPMEAELLIGLLQQHGIAAGMRGAGLVGGIGELPMDALQTPIWTAPAQQTEARSVLREYEQNQHRDDTWVCAHCGEENAYSFDSCWNCEEAREENEQSL